MAPAPPSPCLPCLCVLAWWLVCVCVAIYLVKSRLCPLCGKQVFPCVSSIPIAHRPSSTIDRRNEDTGHRTAAIRIPTPADISIRDTSFAHPLMHPIFEIGLSDGIDFSKSPSPQQQRRRHPHLVSAGPGRRPHQRTVRLMASSHHSSPIRPTSPTTHELSPPRRRPRSSPNAKPVGGPGAFAGNAGEQNTAEGEISTRLSLRRLKQGESHQRVCREKVHEPTTIAEPR